MDEEELKLYIEEFSRSADRWTDLALDSVYRSFDLQQKNSDREFNLLLNITSISTVFLAIVIPLIRNSLSASIILSLATIYFFLASILGVILLISTVKRDKRLINEDSQWEYKNLRKYLDKVMAIRSELYDYKKSPSEKFWIDIQEHIKEYFSSRNELNVEVEKRKIVKEKETSAVILQYLKIFFWSFFAFSIFLLAIWLLFQVS